MAHSEEIVHAGHGKNPNEWLNTHLGGLIMPFGERAEAVMERSMFFFVNNLFTRLSKLFVVVLSPLLLIEFVMRFTGI